LSRYSVGVKKFDHFGNFRVGVVSGKKCVGENRVNSKLIIKKSGRKPELPTLKDTKTIRNLI